MFLLESWNLKEFSSLIFPISLRVNNHFAVWKPRRRVSSRMPRAPCKLILRMRSLAVEFWLGYVAKDVLSFSKGCVQEEILFAVQPELIVACLLFERMGNSDAIILRGSESYSAMTGTSYFIEVSWLGYAFTLEFGQDFVDPTKRYASIIGSLQG